MTTTTTTITQQSIWNEKARGLAAKGQESVASFPIKQQEGMPMLVLCRGDFKCSDFQMLR